MGVRDDTGDDIRDGVPDDARDEASDGVPDDVRDEASDGVPDDARGRDVAAEPPDPLELDLAELRTVQHPVLAEVLAELRERAGQPSEILWGFNNAF
ncbi:FxSxx-COOH cyclophane-containing RiPP peptide [Streptomyces sp. NBC_00728]|uniref:FxSxx-COOH cyclophane-containing RiPP peptide n=1 Tax=Streptomyces sp. NBC_00728 TaxID=2903676 RepID=UPI00386DD1B7